MPSHSATIFTLLDTPAFGGAEQYLLDCLSFLNQDSGNKKDKHKVIVATNNDHVKQKYQQHVDEKGLKKFEIRNLPYLLDAIGNWKGLVKFFWHAPGATWWFYWILKKMKKDNPSLVCFFAGWSDRMLFSPIVKLLGVKLIWVEFGPLSPVFERNWGFPRLLYFLAKRFPDQIVTTCKNTRQSMIEVGGINPSKINLLYPGVKIFNSKEISEFEKIGKDWHKNTNKNEKKEILISFVGRMAQENEPDLLIKSFAMAVQKLPEFNLKLVLMGKGPDLPKFKKIAQNLGIEDKVTFTGFVSEKLKFSILKVSDIFVFPGAWEWEGFGITTIEALTTGTAVIAPYFGPQKEIIQNEVNGLSFKPRSKEDLTKQIVRLVEDTKLRDKLAKQGPITVKQKFSYQILKQQIQQIIESII